MLEWAREVQSGSAISRPLSLENEIGAGDLKYACYSVGAGCKSDDYRAGDRIVVSPTAQVRTGDRVVAKTVEGEVMAKVLTRRTQSKVELASLNTDHKTRTFKPAELAWIARILWVSQ